MGTSARAGGARLVPLGFCGVPWDLIGGMPPWFRVVPRARSRRSGFDTYTGKRCSRTATISGLIVLSFPGTGEIEEVGRGPRRVLGVVVGGFTGRGSTDLDPLGLTGPPGLQDRQDRQGCRDPPGPSDPPAPQRLMSGSPRPGSRLRHLNRGMVGVQETSETPAPMGGWTLSSREETYTFRGFTLQPGARVTVHSGRGTDTSRQLYLKAHHFILGGPARRWKTS